ncbi:MAG TPA: TonB family protein [Terriglobales bacterium]|nr:TonB family protein [Terriglobales bacterium]
MLLIEPPPFWRVFFSNLLDAVLGVRPVQPLLSSRPAPFWPDVFVERPIPWARMRQSALLHLLGTLVLVTLGEMWLRPSAMVVRTDFDRSHVTYYPASDYLPPIDTGSTPQPKPRHGEPAYARQQIVSVPPLHDNTHQTIITPDQIKLPDDVSLPNLVSWTPVPGPAPAEAIADRSQTPHLAESVIAPPPDTERSSTRLIAPALPVDVAPPPPDVLREERLQAPSLAASPVEPPPDPTRRYRMNLPNVGEVTVIEPPPSLRDLHDRNHVLNLPAPEVVAPPVTARGAGKLGARNIAHLDTQVAAPPEPMRIRTGPRGRRRAGRAVAAPSPAVVASAAHSGNAVKQIIALGLNPALPGAPVNVPPGSRYGEFAAGPNGKPEAPGTPDITAAGDGAGNLSAKAIHSLPPGISVAPAPPAESASANVPNAAPAAPISAVNRSLLAAAAMPMKVGDIARQIRPAGSAPAVSDPDPINREVFGARQYYTMQLNMPNLTSAAGSWIIRFAELNVMKSEGDLIAPQVTVKVDPKYPPEAVRNRLQGTVILYAVIRKDGSVGQVRVLHGIDTQLDANACTALQHWHFRPAMKNGSAVDLEAVVQIPFQARKTTF